jgi:hypothetical protein
MSMLHNGTIQYVSVRASAATGTVTDSTLYFTLPVNYFYKGIMIAVDRTAETDWHQLENATVTFADGVTATQYLQVYPGLVGSDSDSAVSLDTNEGKLSGQYLPRECRIYHTTGGTSVANTYSIDAWLLP